MKNVPKVRQKLSYADNTSDRHDHEGGRLFGGAGIGICRPGHMPEYTEGKVIVETDYADELSDLIYQLKAIFKGDLDYLNKYKFYPSLANAAIDHQLFERDDKEIVDAVSLRAAQMADSLGKHLCFAYGSNMDSDQMKDRCPESIPLGVASLEGYRFGLDAVGTATVRPDRDSKVYGSAWLLSYSDEEQLDQYEGVRKWCYRKEYHPVEYKGRLLQMLVYVSCRDEFNGYVRKSDYLPKIIDAAQELGLPEDYIEQIEHSTDETVL